MLNDLQLSSLALFVAAVLCAWAGHFHIMSAERSSDASQGIPAVNDPAALDQKQYANLAEGASLGAGGGAAFGELALDLSVHWHAITHCEGPGCDGT